MPSRISDGQLLTYQGRHQRLRRARGRACDEGPCETCGSPNSEWSQVHGTDGLDIWLDYQRLCRSCHQHYDDPVTERTVHSTSTRRDDSIVSGLEDPIRWAYFSAGLTAPEIATALGLPNGSVYRVLKRDKRYPPKVRFGSKKEVIRP